MLALFVKCLCKLPSIRWLVFARHLRMVVLCGKPTNVAMYVV
jgi:hypothetical protein